MSIDESISLEDGTNVARGTKFAEEIRGRVLPWYEPANGSAPERWKAGWMKLRRRFEKLIDGFGPVECFMIQRRIPKSAPIIPDFPVILNHRRRVRLCNGIRIEPSELFTIDGSQLLGLFPFNNVRGEPMLHADGQPKAFRLGLSHHFILCPEIGTRPMPVPEIIQLATEGTHLVYQLPPAIANSLWRNLPTGFSRSQNADDCLWYDTLFQLSLLQQPGTPLFAQRLDWFENGSIGLVGKGLFPRVPNALRSCAGNDAATEGGYPMSYYAMVPDLARASVAAIDGLLQMEVTPVVRPRKRFKVGLSFTGDRRPFVEQVAINLAAEFTHGGVLYDQFHEAELAQPDLDVYLPNLYKTECDLIAIFLCAGYEQRRWCKLEWRFIRQLISTAEASRIMFLSFDNIGAIPELGILEGDGYVSIRTRSADEIATLIKQRVSLGELP